MGSSYKPEASLNEHPLEGATSEKAWNDSDEAYKLHQAIPGAFPEEPQRILAPPGMLPHFLALKIYFIRSS